MSRKKNKPPQAKGGKGDVKSTDTMSANLSPTNKPDLPNRKEVVGEIEKLGNKPVRYDVNEMRSNIIIPGFGMSVPAFRRYSQTDEETYIPVGIIHGHYSPVGQDAASELYSQLGTLYCQRVLTRLKNLGYANNYTFEQIRNYFNAIASRIQMVKFISDLRTIQNFSEIHSSSSATALVMSALNGRLVKQQQMGIKILSATPFPPLWEKLYMEGFGPTTLSDSHFGPVRMFAPKVFQPDPDQPYIANDLADIMQSSFEALYSVPVYVELMSILGSIFDVREPIPEYSKEPIGFRQGSVNNILNLPYYDGTNNEPVASDVENVRYFYRRKIVPEGTLTYAPDNNVLTTIQSTVWTRQYDGLTESPVQCVAINNQGEAVTVQGDSQLWANFGAIWESSAGLSGAPGPSVAYVNTTFTSVATGVASLYFNE